jgi:hypothetical protein
VVTTADVVPFARRIAAAAPPIGTLVDGAAPALKFTTVERRLEVGDARRPLTVVELSGGPHVNRTLVVIDAATRTVVGGDIYGDTSPFIANFDWFAEWLRGQREIDLVAGTHHAATPVTTVLQRQTEYRRKQ